jgi:glycosyltransferase involved in cell wall biosynthesis
MFVTSDFQNEYDRPELSRTWIENESSFTRRPVTLAPLLDGAFLADRYAGRRSDVFAVARAYVSRVGRLFRRGAFDLLWLEKEAFPWIPDAIERAIVGHDMPLVVDFDDAWFHRYDLHERKTVRALLGGKLDHVMRRATVVAAGNEYIADRARKAGASSVEIVPTVVDLARYPDAAPRPPGPFTVGWIGTPLTAGYLDAIAPALAEAGRGQPVRLCAVGAAPFAIDGVEVVTPAWTEEGEAAAIAGFDVGVMPLPDSPWERGKCGYKLIQYMACRKPVIASPVGVNRSLVTDGVNGYLAGDLPAWARALAALRDDPARRASMGEAGRTLVAGSYDLRIWCPRVAAMLRAAAAPKGSR